MDLEPTAKSLLSVSSRPRRESDVPRVVLGALALFEAAILLQIYFRVPLLPKVDWKGWGVLYALAAAAIALAMLLLWFLAAALFRLNFKFSIRRLRFLGVLAAIPCTLFAVATYQAGKQRETRAAIKSMGGSVFYDYETHGLSNVVGATSPTPLFWRQLLRDDFFAKVTLVTLGSENDLRCLQRLPDLLVLRLDNATDDSLKSVEPVTSLKSLLVSESEVTDAGLEHLEGLTKLEGLWLVNTRVTDAGLAHLKGLSRLSQLDVAHTGVTEKGATSLHEAIPQCIIFWDDNRHIP